jgi:hypothetical protein
MSAGPPTPALGRSGLAMDSERSMLTVLSPPGPSRATTAAIRRLDGGAD